MIDGPRPPTLVIGVDGDVGDVGTVDTVGKRTAGADHVVTAVDEAREHAVAEYRRRPRLEA